MIFSTPPIQSKPLRHGSIIVLVVWAIAVGSFLVAAIILFGFRQASIGTEVAQQIQARWAARAGVEYSIAMMADHTLKPESNNALRLYQDLELVSSGSFKNATYSILHYRDGRQLPGPFDEHSKMNIALANGGFLLSLDDYKMDLSLADAFLDWIDEDEIPGLLGVERKWYQSLNNPYLPRNGPVRSTAELELVAGAWPEIMRGEDWNLNNRLDPTENDGDDIWPKDDRDGQLDKGILSFITGYSSENLPTASGLPRIDLEYATNAELVERIGVEPLQAQRLIYFGQGEKPELFLLPTTPLENIRSGGQVLNAGGSSNSTDQEPSFDAGTSGVEPDSALEQTEPVPPLTTEQFRAIFAECTTKPNGIRHPGKMNINTVSEELLTKILNPEDEPNSDGENALNEILYLRQSGSGIVSIYDLMDIPSIGMPMWQQIARQFDTQSSIFTISSVGTSAAGHTAVELVVTVDRSTVPVRILEYREQ